MIRYTSGRAFVPDTGKCYEIHFGEVTHGGQTGFLSARIRADGPHPHQWIDLDTCQTLDAGVQAYIVQAWREIPCTAC